MKASRLVVACAVLAIAGAARATSSIPGNYVDDFGSLDPSTPSTMETVVTASYSSPVFANYIDNFGPLVSESAAPAEDGAASGEPGSEAKAAERAQENAAGAAYNHERFMHEVWASP